VSIEAVTPSSDQIAGVTNAIEQMFVQAFVTHSAIEAFNKAVLHRFAWGDVVPVGLTAFLRFQDRIRRQLSPVANGRSSQWRNALATR
jgi:hypothetical protein